MTDSSSNTSGSGETRPAQRAAQIVGEVVSRQGDGANLVIPKGPVQIQLTAADATISWVDGDTHGLAAMPRTDFNRHLTSHAIRWLDAAGG
jgi:hypothetical protein